MSAMFFNTNFYACSDYNVCILVLQELFLLDLQKYQPVLLIFEIVHIRSFFYAVQ